MDWFLKTLKERYDVMIMDSSPVLAVSDTSIIVPKVDGVALVYRAGFTSRLALRRAKMQIENVKKNVIRGIVLNNVTPEISMDTYYYYHRGEYYKDKQEPEKSKA
jgi:Mrp family chromosome partitioning ATPase